MTIHDLLKDLLDGAPFDAMRVETLMDHILQGACDEAQIGAALAMLQVRGVGFEQLLGGARAMRKHLIPVSTDGLTGAVIDTCGTGGAPKTFNISTIAAIVTAAAGEGRVHVAKHGNRSRTGRGSAELLGKLGVNVDAAPQVQASCLREAGVCFCFAIHHHPAAKHVGPARRSLAFATIFNLLGPLCNPAGAKHQLVGVFDAKYVEPMARTLATLGTVRAMVVHGRDGLDEFTSTGPTLVGHVEGDHVWLEEMDASHFGVARTHIETLGVPGLEESVELARGILEGQIRDARSEIVILNSALALHVAGVVESVPEGMTCARAAIDKGRAIETLCRLAALSHHNV